MLQGRGRRMKTNSKIKVVLIAAVLWASPVHAQQPEPSLPEQLIEGVRSLFGRIFGGGNQASEPQRAEPAPQTAPPPNAQPATPSAAPAPVATVAPAAPVTP